MNDILNRLKRVEGQIRGLQKMIADQDDCEKFLTQLAAAKAALEQTGMIVVAKNMRKCVFTDIADDVLVKSFDDSMAVFLKHINSLKG